MIGERAARRPEPGVFGRARVPLLTSAEAGAADATAREQYSIPGRVLMESAGRAAAMVLDRLWPRGRIVGLAGPGNNGGDLLVMMRTLRAWGRDTVIIAAGSREPDVSLLHGADIPLLSGAAAESGAASADVVADGLLGTGASGAPRGDIAEWIARTVESHRPVLALDIPSGVDATTGAVHDPAIRAEATITFGSPKLGLLLHPARAHCGRLINVEIGFPEAVGRSSAALVTSGWVRDRLRPRDATAHKGSAGRLLIVAGQEGMAGAAAIAARAALRSGAGLVRIASAAANRVVLQSIVPEATFLDRMLLSDDDVEPLHALLAGPGAGTDADAHTSLHAVLELMRGKPTLLDADALNLLAREPGSLRAAAAATPLVITPHARELARLTGTALEDILGDTPGAARAAAREFSCVVLLKGQPSLIAAPDGELLVNSVGSSDVAAAGMGDQLAGTIASLLAAGHEPIDAAALGLYLSGRAADLAGLGRSLTPADVTEFLSHAVLDPGPLRSSLEFPFISFDQAARW